MEDDKVVFIISVEMISVMSSSLKELRLTLTSAMREKLTQTQIISLLSMLASVASMTVRRLRSSVRSVE